MDGAIIFLMVFFGIFIIMVIIMLLMLKKGKSSGESMFFERDDFICLAEPAIKGKIIDTPIRPEQGGGISFMVLYRPPNQMKVEEYGPIPGTPDKAFDITRSPGKPACWILKIGRFGRGGYMDTVNKQIPEMISEQTKADEIIELQQGALETARKLHSMDEKEMLKDFADKQKTLPQTDNRQQDDKFKRRTGFRGDDSD